ncbi:MAG: hypothetical protein EXR77_01890 [Myxococcales bacterium]|nr:hypothetical protein [Myxococcales bacterium]
MGDATPRALKLLDFAQNVCTTTAVELTLPNLQNSLHYCPRVAWPIASDHRRRAVCALNRSSQ